MGLGEQLRNARLSLNLTASQIAAGTRMKVQMVEQLEKEDFRKVAAPIYGKGFIKLYAEYVGLDPKPLIDEYMFRFVDHIKVPSTQLDSSTQLGMMDVPDVSEKPEVHEEPVDVEISELPAEEVIPVKPVEIKLPEKKAEHESQPKESDSSGIPDLFDAVNVSKQMKANSLLEEAGRAMDQFRSEVSEKPEESQSSERSSFAEVYECAVQKCSDLLDLTKSKASRILQNFLRFDSSEVSEESEDSNKLDLLNNPRLVVTAVVVAVVVLILVAFALKKPSTTVPGGIESGKEELELVEEPPAPYVD